MNSKRFEVICALYDLAGLAHEEYEASKTDKRVNVKESKTSTGDKATTTDTEREVIEKRASGNPAFLNLVKSCVDTIAELEQVVPPKKIAPTDPTGTLPYEFTGGEEFKRLKSIANELLGLRKEKMPESTTKKP